ncbi:MAG TPA: hypothetical protein VJV04_05095 [Nitrospiraceae bacterium]|nr:hypothetical protein [Nitrospiraceae bacterium]
MNLTVESTVEPSVSESSSCHSLKEHAHEPAWLSEETCESTVPPSARPVPGPTQRRAVERKRLTVSLPLELLERSRNTVYWTKGLTLARLLEQALTRSLDQREELNGQPFPRRLEDLKGGRPRNSDR